MGFSRAASQDARSRRGRICAAALLAISLHAGASPPPDAALIAPAPRIHLIGPIIDVPQLDAAVEFYTSIFGMEVTDRRVIGSVVTQVTLTVPVANHLLEGVILQYDPKQGT